MAFRSAIVVGGARPARSSSALLYRSPVVWTPSLRASGNAQTASAPGPAKWNRSGTRARMSAMSGSAPRSASSPSRSQPRTCWPLIITRPMGSPDAIDARASRSHSGPPPGSSRMSHARPGCVDLKSSKTFSSAGWVPGSPACEMTVIGPTPAAVSSGRAVEHAAMRGPTTPPATMSEPSFRMSRRAHSGEARPGGAMRSVFRRRSNPPSASSSPGTRGSVGARGTASSTIATRSQPAGPCALVVTWSRSRRDTADGAPYRPR